MRFDIGLVMFFKEWIRFQDYKSDEACRSSVKKIMLGFIKGLRSPILVPFCVRD
jgi:hypothetical protein